MKTLVKSMVLLAALWAVFSWPVSAAASDMGRMIERIAILTGLPETEPPSAIREAPLSEIIRVTRKSYARAVYVCATRAILYAPGHRWLIPHEVTHMLQCDSGVIPVTVVSEKQAWWIQNIYGRLWPTEEH